MPASDYERFKWKVLGHAPHRLGVDAAWYEAREVAPDDVDTQAELVQRAVLELFDAGLISCAYASEDESYKLKQHEFVPTDRAALERDISESVELARAAQTWQPRRRPFWHRWRRRQNVEPERVTSLYLLPTEDGCRLLDSLPPEAFLNEATGVEPGLPEWPEQ